MGFPSQVTSDMLTEDKELEVKSNQMEARMADG